MKKSVLVLFAMLVASTSAFAQGSQLAERIEAKVQEQFKKDTRIIMNTAEGELCGFSGKVTTVEVQIAKGHRSGEFQSTIEWETIATYSIPTDEAQAGTYKEMWGPRNVCLE